MNANKALWEKGDFTRLARYMRASGDAIVDELGISPGMKVLDLGCGDGTTAVPAAKRGADVLGVDIASNLVAAGNARAREAGFDNLSFQEGDASDLRDLADARFDLVVTMFGAMFAPRPYDVAREMVRVVRPGGRIVMGNWIPDDPTLVAQVLKTSSAYAPPPPEGFVSPMLWGREDEVRNRFVAAGVPADAVSFARKPYAFRTDGTPAALLDDFINFYGPTMNAVAAAEMTGKGDELKQRLRALFEGQNTSADPARTEIVATYLQVSVARP